MTEERSTRTRERIQNTEFGIRNLYFSYERAVLNKEGRFRIKSFRPEFFLH